MFVISLLHKEHTDDCYVVERKTSGCLLAHAKVSLQQAHGGDHFCSSARFYRDFHGSYKSIQRLLSLERVKERIRG